MTDERSSDDVDTTDLAGALLCDLRSVSAVYSASGKFLRFQPVLDPFELDRYDFDGDDADPVLTLWFHHAGSDELIRVIVHLNHLLAYPTSGREPRCPSREAVIASWATIMLDEALATRNPGVTEFEL